MPEMDFGPLPDSRLQSSTPESSTPVSRDIYCFSQTRPSLKVTAEVEHEGRAPEKDPFEISQPQALDAQERLKLAEDLQIPALILCAYRVQVTLRRASPDGTVPFELGVFRRQVRFSSEDAGIDDQRTIVTGQVQGLVTVGTSADSGRVSLGPFPASDGAKRTIQLHSDVRGLELEVDASRTPPWLAPPELTGPEVSAGGHRSWQLKVRVPGGNTVTGHFPDPLVPAFHDSAIYIKTREKTPRTIRIPVSGIANVN
jgi:hypothetical protein